MENLVIMKILVTGSEGYIGSVLLHVLVDKGHDVCGLDTGFYKEAMLYDNGKKPVPTIVKDIRDVSREDLLGFDAIVHLAELSNDPLGQTDPDLTFAINHKGTARLIDKAKKAGVKRFIYASSCSVYGASDEIRSEISTPNPLTAYAKCKILNEELLKKEATDSFTPVILRFATVYGLSPRLRFDLVVNNLAGLAFTTGVIKMDSDGTPWRPFTHVLDIAEGVSCALVAPKEIVSKEIFNVGNESSNYQIKDIANIIKTVFPKAEISLNPNGTDKRNYKVDFTKINTKLPGFACTRTIAIGAKELKDAFEKAHLTDGMFSSRLFTRLKQIFFLQETNRLDKNLYWTK